MELRVEFAEFTLERAQVVLGPAEMGGYFDHEYQQKHAIPGAPYIFPDMELACVLEDDKCIRHVSDD